MASKRLQRTDNERRRGHCKTTDPRLASAEKRLFRRASWISRENLPIPKLQRGVWKGNEAPFDGQRSHGLRETEIAPWSRKSIYSPVANKIQFEREASNGTQ